MSMFTPTASSSFFAGVGLWGVIWSAVYKIESVAKMFGLGRFVSKEGILAWISGHKVVTLIGTETINFGIHGLENPNSVTMAIGGTITNCVMLFIVLPTRNLIRRLQS